MIISSIIWIVGGALFALCYRLIHKKFAKPGALTLGSKNIGKNDRLVRVIIGILLVILYFWYGASPLALFFAGFSFFEAAFSWCGFYAVIGKNTCPLE